MTESSLLEFPTEYPVKVVGRVDPALRARIDAVVGTHVPDFDLARATERRSGKDNFVAYTYPLHVTSRAQVVALVEALQACEGVLMVL